MCVESGSLNITVVENAIPSLISKIQQFDLDDIYNFDETALFYKLEPDTTLGTKRISGQRITIAFCTNSRGSDKRKPLVIAKFANPGCFKNVNLSNVGVQHSYNKKSVDGYIYISKYLTDFDK
ncbi:hypothetical protein B4U80_02239 [Leptotrombidium deliense]|uniref:DDE-1 domain-containing protein n=1 Tax=Leptotrombidium deliense TaxID=299467 RepID=A0A443RS69_9ACAR|nr:hypothetical protein B4U80_02239 [Leptotrombidium deliense]